MVRPLNQPLVTPDQANTDPIGGLVLDRSNASPFWRQLYEQISAKLQAGELGSGVGLPSERDLAAALQVSRSTVKRCYDELRHQGLLSGRGRGGSVLKTVERVQPVLGALKGFTQEMAELGKVASTQLLCCEVRRDRAIASIFARPSDAPFLHVVRVRLGDQVPMTREVAWYDLSQAPQLAQWTGMGSAYAYLTDHCAVQLGAAEQTVEAVLSSDSENSAFGFRQPQPCLLFKRKVFNALGQLVEYVEGTFRGDLYVYRLALQV